MLRLVLAVVAIAFAASVAPAGCAGTGHRYDLCTDGGDLDAGQGSGCTRPDPDAGPILPTGFISEPTLVRHDGLHNGGSDLVAFGGGHVAVFRNGANWSADSSGKLIVSRTTDEGAHWVGLTELKLAGKDLREPKLAVFQDKVRLTATAWDPRDASAHDTSVMSWTSADGTTWDPAVDSLIPYRYSAWRPRPVLDRLWVSVWHADELFPSSTVGNLLMLYTSGDGVTYSELSGLPVGPGARQAELLVRQNGQLWAVVPERALGLEHDRTTLCFTPLAATPDWTCWSVNAPLVEAPVLFEQKGLLFVLARHDIGQGRRRTGLYQVVEADQTLSSVADLPSSQGDTGTPGLVRLDADRVLVTFHTTSALDPNVQVLGHEPTLIEAQSQRFAADVQAVRLDLRKAAVGQ